VAHSHPAYHTVHIAQRENVIVNRLNKTKVERVVDHEAEQIERVKRENAAKRAAAAAKVRFTYPHSFIHEDISPDAIFPIHRKRKI
jgi:hypothetical protein